MILIALTIQLSSKFHILSKVFKLDQLSLDYIFFVQHLERRGFFISLLFMNSSQNRALDDQEIWLPRKDPHRSNLPRQEIAWGPPLEARNSELVRVRNRQLLSRHALVCIFFFLLFTSFLATLISRGSSHTLVCRTCTCVRRVISFFFFFTFQKRGSEGAK